MVGSTVRSTGDKLTVSAQKPVFVHGAWNCGPVYEWKEITGTAFYPGQGVDPADTGADMEDHVTIMADTSVRVLGVAEIDFGQINLCSATYATGDVVPVIYFHWNPGALVQYIWMKNFSADLEAGEVIGTTSGADGYFYDVQTTGECMTSYKFVADPTNDTGRILAFIHGFL